MNLASKQCVPCKGGASRSRVRPEMARRRALAHPVPARQADLAIQLHGVNPPALPVTGKG